MSYDQLKVGLEDDATDPIGSARSRRIGNEVSDTGDTLSSRADTDDEDDRDNTCVWEVEVRDSVYDDGVLRILQWQTQFEKRGLVGGCCNVGALFLLVFCNFALQMTIVLRVFTLVELGNARTATKVFRPTGTCVSLEANIIGALTHNFAHQQDNYWSCGPVLPFVMATDVNSLDVNKDGKWSEEDDLSVYDDKWKNEYRALGGKLDIFPRFIKDIKEGNSRFQIKNGLSYDEAEEATNEFSSIPLSWLRAEQNILKLCTVVNKDLCGNLELRGSLKAVFPDRSEPAYRVDDCRQALDRCETIFGEVYRSYRMRASESCGGMNSGFNDEHLVIVNRFKDAEMYDGYTNKQAITTYTYEVFLLLVLVIWWLLVIDEMRQCFYWWMVLFNIPSGDTVVKEDEDSLEVVSISKNHKFWIFGLIVLLRTVIIICLSYNGTEFLIVADSYADLILNSTALGFLIEVDEQLFNAVASLNTKSRIEKTQNVSGSHRCNRSCVKMSDTLPTSIGYLSLVILLAVGQAYRAYVRPFGKMQLAQAYRCLCHAEGEQCISSQLIGGDFFLDGKYL